MDGVTFKHGGGLTAIPLSSTSLLSHINYNQITGGWGPQRVKR